MQMLSDSSNFPGPDFCAARLLQLLERLNGLVSFRVQFNNGCLIKNRQWLLASDRRQRQGFSYMGRWFLAHYGLSSPHNLATTPDSKNGSTELTFNGSDRTRRSDATGLNSRLRFSGSNQQTRIKRKVGRRADCDLLEIGMGRIEHEVRFLRDEDAGHSKYGRAQRACPVIA
jgi:hypothetical protein